MKLGEGLVEKDDSMSTDEVGRVVDDDDDDQMEAAEFVIEMDDGVQAHQRHQVDDQGGEDGES